MINIPITKILFLDIETVIKEQIMNNSYVEIFAHLSLDNS